MKTPDNILRPLYMDKIMPYVGKGIIKILTGQRRIGKSYILHSVGENIRSNDPEANFISIRNAIIGYRPQDISGLLENAVYNKLCGFQCTIINEVIQTNLEFKSVLRYEPADLLEGMNKNCLRINQLLQS